MSYVVKDKTYRKVNSSDRVDKLPQGVYILDGNNLQNYCLIKQDNFDIPNKVYGDSLNVSKRYLETFKDRDSNTNILLTGEKGNGKSLLAKLICKNSNIPSIIITKYIEDFPLIMNDIRQECIILIDEFDKIYDNEEKQSELLSLLDGVFTSKKMFIFTSNKSRLNPFLQNRPGRIYYYKSFDNLDRSVIEEIVDDRLINNQHRDRLIDIANIIGNTNIDTLLSIIEEVNRYNEDPFKSAEYLNITFEDIKYNVVLIIGGNRFQSIFVGHPLKTNKFTIDYKKDGDAYWDRQQFSVNINDFNVDFSDREVIEFRNKSNSDILIFRRVEFDKKFKFNTDY